MIEKSNDWDTVFECISFAGMGIWHNCYMTSVSVKKPPTKTFLIQCVIITIHKGVCIIQGRMVYLAYLTFFLIRVAKQWIIKQSTYQCLKARKYHFSEMEWLFSFTATQW